MPMDAKWWEILQFLPNKTEAKVLGTLTRIERGNAYQIWKYSGLKHYPTVLRTLKKLEKKRLIRVLDVRSARGEKHFPIRYKVRLFSTFPMVTIRKLWSWH